jgi:hypothetical protein
MIGCGLAGGNWNNYLKHLNNFAKKIEEQGANVLVYQLNKPVR